MSRIILGKLEPHENLYYEIEYWYETKEKHWVVQVLNDIETRIYCEEGLNRKELIDALDELKRIYNVTQIRHL